MNNNPIFNSWLNETEEGLIIQSKPHQKEILQKAFEAGMRYAYGHSKCVHNTKSLQPATIKKVDVSLPPPIAIP
jgi:hypothetical protein